MNTIARRLPHVAAYVMCALLASALIGCGGGGGGGGTTTSSMYGRSFSYTSGGQTCQMTVDADGRFTIHAVDPTNLPSGGGAQGTLPTGGQFTAQSSDGTVQFTGQVSGSGSTLDGTVRVNGTTAFVFTTPVLSASTATPASLRGTYQGTSGSTTAILSVDPTGHATVSVSDTSTPGGGLVAVGSDGSLSSADGSVAGSLQASGSTYTLTLTRLGGNAVNLSIPVSHTSRAKWTFLVYLNGANNLQPYGGLNVNQMEEVGSDSDVNIVVQWKQASCTTCGSPDWVGTRRYLIQRDANTSQVSSTIVQNMGTNVDMGDWRVLLNFITWAQTTYPADHYALVIWNHGAGWRPTRANRLASFPRSVSIDDSTDNEIQTWQLPQALNVSPKLDMVIFDASLMQMTEVAYEIRDMASIVVGSEESPPGEGYVYNTFLTDLETNPNMSASTFGASIVNRTLESYGSSGNNTQSVIDLSQMSNVATKLNAFAVALQANTSSNIAVTRNARNNADSYAYPDNKDLYNYAELIRQATPTSSVKDAAASLETAITSAVLTEAHGSLHSGSHGIAIYVPDPSNYLTSYANLALARATSWGQWLQNQP